jgi:primosomal protein N'
MEQWRSIAIAHHADFVVQTHSIPLFESYLRAPTNFLIQELHERDAYAFPPYTRIARMHFMEPEKYRADLLFQSFVKRIRQDLTHVLIQKIATTKQHRHEIEIKCREEEADMLLTVLHTFPDSVRIDMHADSL